MRRRSCNKYLDIHYRNRTESTIMIGGEINKEERKKRKLKNGEYKEEEEKRQQ